MWTLPDLRSFICVGGLSALLGAWMLGPRLGKYSKEKNGKIQVNAIPGHSLTLGALGCFILWFCWYGFTGAAASDVTQMAQILGTTTIGARGGHRVLHGIYLDSERKAGRVHVPERLSGRAGGRLPPPVPRWTWWGPPPSARWSGVLVVAAVEFIDQKLHVDDPVGAVAVHCANGIWGHHRRGAVQHQRGPVLRRRRDPSGRPVSGVWSPLEATLWP